MVNPVSLGLPNSYYNILNPQGTSSSAPGSASSAGIGPSDVASLLQPSTSSTGVTTPLTGGQPGSSGVQLSANVVTLLQQLFSGDSTDPTLGLLGGSGINNDQTAALLGGSSAGGIGSLLGKPEGGVLSSVFSSVVSSALNNAQAAAANKAAIGSTAFQIALATYQAGTQAAQTQSQTGTSTVA